MGCARNDVDSDELAGRLLADGWELADSPKAADVVLVNTCGFIDAAKSDSISTVLELSDSAHVVATGCMAERYGSELAQALPEADAVLGFDHYPVIGQTLRRVLGGEHISSHQPRDRRQLLPVTPVKRRATGLAIPGHSAAGALGGTADRIIIRHRLGTGPVAALKIASGCDRRCSFCAIPAFRGAFVSRTPDEILAEARSLVEQGVREVVLVSENSTAYGKDLPGSGGLAGLLRQLATVDGLFRIRASYLQPAEIRPDLLDTMADLDVVADYYDISFQHASGDLLRRMRRFGDAESFLGLVEGIRQRSPQAGIRSNVILGFPGETDRDVAILTDFLNRARLDAIGVFGYSDEDGTEAASLEPKVPSDLIDQRVAAVTELADVLAEDRAQQRVGVDTVVLVEEGRRGRAAHQGPEDGGAVLLGGPDPAPGDLVSGRVVACDGADLTIAVAGLAL